MIEKIDKIKANIYRTDLNGEIGLTIDSKGNIKIQCKLDSMKKH